MSLPDKFPPVMLAISVLYNDEAILEQMVEDLGVLFGKIVLRSEPYQFDKTSYYEPEMGENILRSFITFEQHVSPATQAETKLRTNSIESEFIENGQRRVNLDPGILTAHNLILTTGKDFSHRIYLQNGIFAEVTLMVNKGRLSPLQWTYADYQSPIALDFFEKQRQEFLAYRKKGNR